MITRNVPDYALMIGVPAQQDGWMCECGVRLPRPVSKTAACVSCGTKYRIAGGRCSPAETPVIEISGTPIEAHFDSAAA